MSALLRLFPAPVEAVPLEGLYLAQALRTRGDPARAFVYSNFIASLDGRIALKSSHADPGIVPDSIANPADWRLFQELAAQADVVIMSGRYARQLAKGSAQDVLPVSEEPPYRDLLGWRQAHGLTPQPAVVIVSASLEVPITETLWRGGRSVFVATGSKADAARVRALDQRGVSVLYAGTGREVQGRSLIEALQQKGFRIIYSTAGPQVLTTLLADRLLDRLYLTQVHRILGGEDYATLSEGARFCPPVDFELRALYYEAPAGDQVGQTFSVYAATEKTA
jgi:riboflavin biosynthesis pyrimidine reductase